MGQDVEPRKRVVICRTCKMSTPHDDRHVRFYCPRCGEVTCGKRRHGKWIVAPHYRQDLDAIIAEKGGTFATRPCLGGEVDPKRDRAP